VCEHRLSANADFFEAEDDDYFFQSAWDDEEDGVAQEKGQRADGADV
jgi:hypothetical protein